MLVKSFLVSVKFLILISIASPALANVNIPLSATNGVRQDYQANTSFISLGVNLFKVFSGSLGFEDKQTHIMTVMHAMQNLDNDEIAEWYSAQNDTAGRVRVVMTYPVQGGVCRRFFTEVRIKNHIRDYTEVGCKTIDSQYWSFSR